LASAWPLPTTFPLEDGFPNPNPDQLAQIEQQAFGTLSNSTPPVNITSDSLDNFRVIAFNEIFETLFFVQLLRNITDGIDGYEIPDDWDSEFLIRQINITVAQEQLHALTANGALQHFGADPIQPCTNYNFPVSSLYEAIDFAATFTSVVLGTLQDVIVNFAQTPEQAGFTGAIASVIGQEGEQEGWYRVLLGKIPNELPFLTRSTRELAFSILQTFVDPASCPNIGDIQLKTLKPLTLLNPPNATDSTIYLSVATTDLNSTAPLNAVYINQQNVPVVVPTTNSTQDGQTIFAAEFPYVAHELNGLTLILLTDSEGPFASAEDATAASNIGPAIAIIN
ncbi:hypothetical protein TREMEDRAFT_22632, partial [Tremella mesenterica DSM 1558]|uniref:uncharacterized protein n=1 Tax=Tremella mesenterica (strain ATCC 24925 / CBS 8224 / DSM 1558 / NBRC 9311 / NRRL Y-6157 / RJB 2259-6 / UBC 559-6) TaxID=578456 RepID=UPI0003F493AA